MWAFKGATACAPDRRFIDFLNMAFPDLGLRLDEVGQQRLPNAGGSTPASRWCYNLPLGRLGFADCASEFFAKLSDGMPA